MLYFTLRLISVLLCNVFLGIRVYGRKNIPKKGGFILASNHVSHLDPVALGVACPRKLNFMAKEELFLHPFFGGLISRLGAFPVKRNSADRSALKEAMKRLKQGRGLLLFPEGTRQGASGNAAVMPQAGVGFLAAKVGVPVVPAYINGTQAALPRGAKWIKPGSRVSVYFGEKIDIERRLPYHEFAQVIMAKIRQLSC